MKNYEAALEIWKAAAKEWRIIQTNYRARAIGDTEFLNGKAKFDEAQKALDKAKMEVK